MKGKSRKRQIPWELKTWLLFIVSWGSRECLPMLKYFQKDFPMINPFKSIHLSKIWFTWETFWAKPKIWKVFMHFHKDLGGHKYEFWHETISFVFGMRWQKIRDFSNHIYFWSFLLKILERPRECLVKSFEHLKAITFGSLQEEVNRRRKCPVEKNGAVEKKWFRGKLMRQRSMV
jgi:hypothetical protein